MPALRIHTRFLMAPVAVALVAVLAGCSGADSGAEGGTNTAAGDAAGEVGGDAGDAAGGETAEETATEATDGDETSGGEAGGGAEPVQVGGDTAGRQVIREAHLTLASDDPDATVEAVTAAVERVGGFVAGTDLTREGGVLVGTVTLRVPATELPDALGRIEAAGAEVTARQLSSRDVTTKVADVAAQLRNLRALEEELLALLAEARAEGGTEDVLRVFDRIRTVRDEIERLEGRRTTLADLVALATITVSIEPSVDLLAQTAEQRDPVASPWSPVRQLDRAWQATLGGMQGVANLAIWLVVTVLPLVLVVVLPLVGAWAAVRTLRGAPRSVRSRPDVGQD